MQIYIIYCDNPILFQLKLNFHSVSLNQSIHKGRKKRSLNVAQLAARIGVSAQAASQWEQGESEPRGNNLIKLAEVLNTAPEYIQFGCVNLAGFKSPG
jgi:transcriptional regulator with XRE-family HTH domain